MNFALGDLGLLVVCYQACESTQESRRQQGDALMIVQDLLDIVRCKVSHVTCAKLVLELKPDDLAAAPVLGGCV